MGCSPEDAHWRRIAPRSAACAGGCASTPGNRSAQMAWNSGTSGARNLHSLTSTSARSVSAASSSSGHLKGCGSRTDSGLLLYVRTPFSLTSLLLKTSMCCLSHCKHLLARPDSRSLTMCLCCNTLNAGRVCKSCRRRVCPSTESRRRWGALALEDGRRAQHGHDGAHAVVVVRCAAQLLAAQPVCGHDLPRTVLCLHAAHAQVSAGVEQRCDA